jgi:hypothetical protein
MKASWNSICRTGAPDIEAAVVQMMLAATGSEDDVRSALADYAESSGLTAALSWDRGSLAVAIS